MSQSFPNVPVFSNRSVPNRSVPNRSWPLMMWALILVAALGIAEPATAESGVEITPMIGYRTGGTEVSTGIFCIAVDEFTSPCPHTAESQDGTSLGLIADFALNDRWSFEVVLNRQEADLNAELIVCEVCDFLVIDPVLDDLEITTLHVGVQRRWRQGRVQPFVAIGAGISRLSTDHFRFGLIQIDEQRPSVSLAGGIQLPINDWLGVRFEARGYWIDLPTDEFPFLEDLEQSELAGGLTFRW